MLEKFNCKHCNSEFKRYTYKNSTSKPGFCSIKCRATWNGLYNNPNKGNKWSKEQKLAQSNLVKERMDNSLVKEACGSANKGKKFSDERIQKMHGNRSIESYSHPHTLENRRKIGIKSKEKFSSEFNLKFKQIMVNKGHWIDDKDRTPFSLYSMKSQWIERMWNLFPTELMAPGIYSKTNTKGVVRDHKYSRLSGFKNLVFPELLHHPVNCDIITHSENIKKRFRNPDSITLEDLFDKIEKYDKPWKEQEICLIKIKEYKNGKKYNLVY